MTGQLTLYVDGYFVNAYDAACMIALDEKLLPHSIVRALLRDGQGIPPALHEKSRIGRIPALQHGDFVLTESIAIVEYLEDVFPTPHVLPIEPQPRARAIQLMAWLRIELRALRLERPWWMTVYPATPAPLTPPAAREAAELVDVATRFAPELATWSIATADLALALLRLARTGYELPPVVAELVATTIARPSVRAYIEHPRPPNAPRTY